MKRLKIRKQKLVEEAVNLLVLLAIFSFMLMYFKPELLLMDTTTAGGDTGTHNYPAYYMHEYLIPHGKLIGWAPGWYGGMPMFQFYFPMLFAFMHVLSGIVGINAAFKIVTVLGTFMLPICVLIAMKLFRFKFPIPVIAAAFTLPFLFMEANSMWGGNIPSTLAGEFSYSFSFALTTVFLALLYRGLELSGKKSKYILHNAVLFAFVVFSHLYTMMFAGIVSLFFMLTRKRRKFAERFVYFLKMYGLAMILVAWWMLPMFVNLEYSSAYNHIWNISDWKKIFPDILMPLYFFAAVSFAWAVRHKDKRILYLAFTIPSAALLYKLAPYIGVVDIRFVPFIQFYPLLIAAFGIGKLCERIWIRVDMDIEGLMSALKIALPLIVLGLTLLWVYNHVSFIDYWIEWNYEGFENKNLWGAYSEVNEFLEGDANDPRVVYEHSPKHNDAGTLRAFENLPLFSGRSTLEGLYMQSIATAPFTFYVQSEVSEVASCPFPGYMCTSTNVTNAVPRLRMFNVQHYIARTDKVINDLRYDKTNYAHVKSIPPYEIFELRGEHSYVDVLQHEPVFFLTDDWKQASYEWFTNDRTIDTHLVFTTALKEKYNLRAIDNLKNIVKKPIEGEAECEIEEHIYNEEIRFNTTCIGKPHIIKISYYPNWRVMEGADRIWLVSPSFMLVYPTEENVRLVYAKSSAGMVGELLSYLGIAVALFAIFSRNQNVKRFFHL